MTRQYQKDVTWLRCALNIAQLATCARRRVGCVLVSKSGHILATGYNGPASGQPHCVDVNCPGAAYKSGEGLDVCEAIHAEANALIQCKNHLDVGTAYITAFPCIHCVKLLLNTSCRRICFVDAYSHSQAHDLWIRSGRLTQQISSEDIKNVYGI